MTKESDSQLVQYLREDVSEVKKEHKALKESVEHDIKNIRHAQDNMIRGHTDLAKSISDNYDKIKDVINDKNANLLKVITKNDKDAAIGITEMKTKDAFYWKIIAVIVSIGLLAFGILLRYALAKT